MRIPADIRAEALMAYIPPEARMVEACGLHRRNTYRDILDAVDGPSGKTVISVSRKGLYDILPEGLFHQLDRFDNIPANEYKERFDEECRLQQEEEADARRFFSPFDRALLEIGAAVWGMMQERYSDQNVLSDIILDSLPAEYESNRFVRRAREFVPACAAIRGDITLISMMLRKVMSDEGIRVRAVSAASLFSDTDPRYVCSLDSSPEGEDAYLGNEYGEEETVYAVSYWNEDECGPGFLGFVSELRTFERFVNDFFIGIGSRMRFVVVTDALPVRLSDDICFNYLDYNTNL